MLTDNIWGYLWGKLAYGAMLFGTALTDDSMSANFADPQRLGVWLDARARGRGGGGGTRGDSPLGFGEFDPMAFAPGQPEDPQIETIAWLADYTSQTAKTHSGIWRDLAVRKRKTEVDAADRHHRHARPRGRRPDACTIETLVALIHDVEDGTAARCPSTR